MSKKSKKPAAKAAPKKSAGSGAMKSIKKMLGLGASSKKTPARPFGREKAAAAKPETKKIPAKVLKTKGAPVKGTKTAPVKGAHVTPPVAAKGAKPVVTGKAAKGAAAIPAKLTGKEAKAQVPPAQKGKGVVVSPGKQSRAESSSAPVCREVACELMATTGGYCRMHYIKNWKKIKRKEMILKERKLNHYIEELVSKYPDKYIEAIRQDLASEKDFAKVITDLEIEEGGDDFEAVETESAEGIIDSIKREFDDDGDSF